MSADLRLPDPTIDGLDRMLRVADRVEAKGQHELAAHLRLATASMPTAIAASVAAADDLATTLDLDNSAIVLYLVNDGMLNTITVGCPGMIVGGDVA